MVGYSRKGENLVKNYYWQEAQFPLRIYPTTTVKQKYVERSWAPRLYEHLITLDSNVDTVAAAATNWLLVIFIDPAVDIHVTLRIWDAFLCEARVGNLESRILWKGILNTIFWIYESQIPVPISEILGILGFISDPWCEGNKVLVRWCLALYINQQERLLKCQDQGQVMQILKHRIVDIKVRNS